MSDFSIFKRKRSITARCSSFYTAAISRDEPFYRGCVSQKPYIRQQDVITDRAGLIYGRTSGLFGLVRGGNPARCTGLHRDGIPRKQRRRANGDFSDCGPRILY